MDLITNLDNEVSSLAGGMAVEMILLLIDKWEDDLRREEVINALSIPSLLNHYVRLKISLHHVKKAWDRGWSSLNEEQFSTRYLHLSSLVREARKKYYVAKFRHEGKHDFRCTCRGCRAIKNFS